MLSAFAVMHGTGLTLRAALNARTGQPPAAHNREHFAGWNHFALRYIWKHNHGENTLLRWMPITALPQKARLHQPAFVFVEEFEVNSGLFDSSSHPGNCCVCNRTKEKVAEG